MNKLFAKTLWVLVGLAMFFMSFSLHVRHFEQSNWLVEFSEFDPFDIPEHWTDYFSYELAETGEDLPGKNIQSRNLQNDLRKKFQATNGIHHYGIKAIAFLPAKSQLPIYFPSTDKIPASGYDEMLSLLYLF